MGIGILSLSLVFFSVLNFNRENDETVLYSEEEIIEIARELGMVFRDNEISDNLLDELPEYNTTTNIDTLNNELSTEDTDNINNLQQHTTYREDIVVNISYGTPAIDIAETLYNQNIISDAEGFNNYLIAAGFTNRLKAGNLIFKTHSSFQEATAVLIGRDLLPHEIPY